MKVLIGGGSGFIGRALTRVFKEKGHDVVVISRTARPGAITWSDVEQNGLPGDCDTVINVSGENLLNPLRRWSSEAFKHDVEASRIKTTRLLATLISTSPSVRSWISCSGTSIYPLSTRASQAFTEYDEVPHRKDYLYELAHRCEEAGQLPLDTPTKHVIIRPSLVLGPWGGMVGDMWTQFNLYMGGSFGSGHQIASWIHLDDLARMYLFAAENRLHGVLNGSTPQPVTMDTLTQAIARAMDKRAVLWTPSPLVRMVFDGPRADILLKGNAVFPKRVQDLGFEFKFETLKGALEDIVTQRRAGIRQ